MGVEWYGNCMIFAAHKTKTNIYLVVSEKSSNFASENKITNYGNNNDNSTDYPPYF